jgi:hypothetical protein
VAAGVDAVHQAENQAALEGSPEDVIEFHFSCGPFRNKKLMSPRVPDVCSYVKYFEYQGNKTRKI